MTRLRALPPNTSPAPPNVALVSLTTHCNAACSFCCVGDILNRPELNPSDEKIREVMVSARARGCTTLSFTGGEPTVHPRFAQLCREGRELGYSAITINTNGIKFKSRTWTEEVLAAGLTCADFSIHGHTAELHDEMMSRPGAFDAVVLAMQHLRELAPRYGTTLGSTTVVTSKNAAHVEAIAAFLIDLGFVSLRFKHAFEGAEGTDKQLVSPYASALEPLQRAVALAHARGVGVQVTHFPLCLLGDAAVFATDLLEERVLSITHRQDVASDGRASLHRRVAGEACSRCRLRGSCTGLDERYPSASAEAALRPVETLVDLHRFFERGLQRFEAHSHPVRKAVERLLRDETRALGHASSSPVPTSPVERTMRVGFISPSFRVLEINWMHDYEMVKLGVPTFMGHLHRAGHTDIEHWDFDAQICEEMERDPTAFDLRRYFDGDAVKGFLAGTDDGLREQTEKILDTLGVTEKTIFGISLSAVLDRIANVIAVASLSMCMSKVLKERYPGCTIVFGGLQASPSSLHVELYTQFMEACAFIDYCYLQQGDQVGIQLFRNIVSGDAARSERLERVLYRAQGEIRRGAGMDLDADLVAQATKPGAPRRPGGHDPADDSCTTGDAEATVKPESLLKKRDPAPHPYDLDDDGDARVIGPQECEEVPANVPIFDKRLVDHFRYTGLQIMKRFHFDKEAMLRFSRFENDRIVVLPHIFVRGCNAPCGFCSYAYTKIQGEEIAQTVAGLKFLSETYECKSFHFLNTQINSVYQYCEAFCDQVIAAKLDILWSDCANMRALDERLLEKLRKAGAMRLVFGVEAPDDAMLKYIHKGTKVEKIERLLRASHDLGIWNHVLLIAGMPHETKAKQDRMMEFLQRTAPIIDFYSVSSFYLIASSPWGKDPQKFGIERISDPAQLLEEQAFNEIADGRWESDGLRWPAKKQQIVESTRRFYQTISAAKGQSRCVGGNIDLYLLMFLYSILGHDRKAEISQIYTETARSIGHSPDARPELPRELGNDSFRIEIPVIVGRVNEGDQSQLSYLPFDVIVSPRSAKAPSFCETERYSFAYRTPRSSDDGRHSRDAVTTFQDDWAKTVRKLVALLTPFVKAVDARVAPPTPERMAEAVSVSLPRYAPFANQGYMVIGPPNTRGRTLMERNLQWSGVSS